MWETRVTRMVAVPYEALGGLADEANRRWGIDLISVDMQPGGFCIGWMAEPVAFLDRGPRPLPESMEENLLRIAQEALTNIIKHAKATEATITLDYGPRNVILSIVDNGTGFDAAPRAGPREGHFGLLGITERVNRLRGQVSIAAAPGKGTMVQASLPIPAPALEPVGSQSHIGGEI